METMNEYEICKQLKEIGFLQEGLGDYFGYDDPDWLEKVYKPTLEEMIEWLGDRFIYLDNEFIKEHLEWFATARKLHSKTRRVRHIASAKTPWEAIALLCLEVQNVDS